MKEPTLRQLVAATFQKIANQFRETPNKGVWYPARRVPGAPPVTPYTAINYSIVWACMRVIAETLAMLPWNVYERSGDQTLARPDNPVNYLLSRRPNPDVSAMTLREELIMQMLGWGNSYAQIQWTNAHVPYALWHIPSERMRVDRDEKSGDLVYIIQGDYYNPERVLASDDVLHFRNVAVDGVMGVSTISLAAATIGFGKTLEDFGAIAFRNAPFLSGWLEYPGKLPDQETSDQLKQSWRDKFMGWLHAGEVTILESGMKFNQLQLPFNDAQFLQSRLFQAQEVCRWFRVPQHKVGLLEEASYSNIEALSLDWFNESLLPMTIRLEEELDYKLFEGNVRTSKFFTKHNLTPILKGDLKTRYEAYSVGLRYGFLSINNVLQLEGLDKIAAGDLRTVQLNTVPLEQFSALADVKLEQAAADLAYREAQTEQLELGIANANAAANTDAGDPADLGDPSAAGNDVGDPTSEVLNPNEAANPPDDDMKAGTQAMRRLRFLREQLPDSSGATRRDAIATRPASTTTQKTGQGVSRNGAFHFRPTSPLPGGRRPN